MEESKSGNDRAKLAIDVFCYRIKKYIGAYCAVLGKVDGLIFTGGIGENAPMVRAQSCGGLGFHGIGLDPTKNDATIGKEGEISTATSLTRIFVIPTNEELLIARDAVRAVLGVPQPA